MVEYKELTVREIRKMLKDRGLSQNGTKEVLVARLVDSETIDEPTVTSNGGPTVEVASEPEETTTIEVPATEVDAMPSEIPHPLDEARGHYKGTGSVSGEYLFDDVPGSIAAGSLEEAFEKYRKLPGNFKVPGSH